MTQQEPVSLLVCQNDSVYWNDDDNNQNMIFNMYVDEQKKQMFCLHINIMPDALKQ